MTFRLTSPAFGEGQDIPRRHTCDGDDASPPLAWSASPEGTRSLALIVDDPDAPDPAAPTRTWVHWVLYNLPPNATALNAGLANEHLPPGTVVGLNDSWERSYGGPCPPIGRHRYYHKLYALDCVIPTLPTGTKDELEQAMTGHILAQATLMGTYERGERRL
jgi:Raf kinase inhibitor-like YbhB/YbcL family protein